jgi:putative membrane protein
MEILIRYLHFLSFILLCGSLLAENVLIRKSLTRKEVGILAKVDALFGLSAISVLIAGLLLWFVYGKGFAFYAKNPVFHAKVTLFAIVGLLSIRPTVFFLKQRKGHPEETIGVPKAITAMVRIEMGLVLAIPLFAVLMAKGIGLR